ncbi:MAG: InlB B-repeat-containing protein [Candidatus Nanoarchaeia archaeon]
MLYSITYNMNGGTPQISPSSAYAGASYQISSTVPTKTGYSFLTWSMAIGGVSSNYSPGQTITMPAQNIVFIAVWGNLYQITYSATTATGGTVPVDSNYYGIGASITLKYNTGSLIRTGYVFVGWQYNSVRYAEGSTITLVFGQYTVYAVWSEIYTVEYDGNGNTGGTAPVDSNQYYVALNGSVYSYTVLSRGDIVKSGYYFIGWAFSASATAPDRYEGQSYTASNNVTLYAVWVGDTTISVIAYPTDGGTVSGGGTYTPGDTVTVSASANAGYSFDGWYDGSVLVSEDATYIFTAVESKTLTAHFLNLSKLEISADRTLVYVDVGFTEIVNITTNIVGTVFTVAEGPSSVTVDASGVVSILGICPAGYYRVQIMAVAGVYVESVQIDVFVNTPSLPAISGRERVTIFNSAGGYVSFSDQGALSLASFSEVRYEEDAPRKATVQITNDWMIASKNIRSPYFDGWSDDYIGPVVEGMQIVIDKYDNIVGQQIRVFNDTINKISASGIFVTITAYDSLLSLSEYRSPYILYGSYVEEQSYDLNIVGSDYDYTMIADVNTLIGASLIDTVMDEASYSGTPDSMNTIMWAFCFDSSHGPSNAGGIHKIRKLRAHIIETANLSYRVKIYGGDSMLGGPLGTPVFESEWHTGTSGNVIDYAWDCDYVVHPGAYLYYAIEVVNSTMPTQSIYYGTSSKFESNDFWVYNYGGLSTGWKKVGVSVNPGNTIWPTVEVEYEDAPRSIDISTVTISGTNIIVVPDAIAINPSAYESAIAIIARFFSSNRPASMMVADLIRRAGLYTDGLAAPTKILTYYDTSSYDYLSCIQDLMGAAADDGVHQGSLMTVQASITYPRMILCAYKHKTTDAYDIAITTDPFGVDLKIVKAHSLQKTFETEVSRPTILSELDSGAPIALQTDDLLYGSASLESRLGYRTISIITDSTLQTHAALAISAEAIIKKNHRNTLEGQAILTRIAPSLWSMDGDAYGSGKVVSIDVPQYGAKVNGITRIMTIAGYNTTLNLDNVRLDNRSILNQSVSRGQDAQTYSIASLPSSAYVFVRLDDVISSNVDDYVSIRIIDADDNDVSTSSVIRITTDNASPDVSGGYVHVSALYDLSPTGYATTSPIKYVEVNTITETYYVMVMEPVYAWPSQYVHVSVRGRRT